MINYTIIIPHKNIPHLLQKCLDSIPSRDDVQIIVIDDNSDADIVDFENFPGLNDPYIEVVFGKNENGRQGAGYARNLGLEKAIGKWLIFADADDFFMPCFNDVLNKYKDDESDIIYFKITSIDLETIQQTSIHKFINEHLEQIQKNGDWNFVYRYFPPWGKLIKRRLIKSNNISFSEVQWGNDVFFTVKSTCFAVSKKISDDIIYCYTSNESSLTKETSLKSLSVKFKENYRAIVFLKRRGNKQNSTSHLCNLWLRISKVSILNSILLIPKMVYAGRGRFVASNIIKSDVYSKKIIFN